MPQTIELAPKIVPSDEHILHQMEAELMHDPHVRVAFLKHEAAAKAEQLIRSVGNVALSGAGEAEKKEITLLEAAKQGNIPFITENARTDVIERTWKSGHIMKVRQTLNAMGEVEQHGQSSEQTQKNTLRYANANPLIKPRTAAETKNMYYLDSLRREGYLKDNYAVVVSLCPDADDATLDKLGFFAFSKSLVIQATTEEQAEVTTESGFIAGVKRDGANRYDHDVAVEFGAQFGEDWHGLDSASIIGRVLLIPKSQMPNGVIDLVRLWDDLAGGTFFGTANPRQDYLNYLAVCQQREKEFEPTVQKIVADLVALAPALQTPLDATQALNKISAKHTLQRAVVDRSIDVRVFGAKAALDVEEARYHYEQGNHAQVHLALANARKNETSGSCASGATFGSEDSLYNVDGTLKSPEQVEQERKEKEEGESDEHGSLVFYCTEGHKNTRQRGELLTVCQTRPCKAGSVGCGDEHTEVAKSTTVRETFTEIFKAEMRKIFETDQAEAAQQKIPSPSKGLAAV